MAVYAIASTCADCSRGYVNLNAAVLKHGIFADLTNVDQLMHATCHIESIGHAQDKLACNSMIRVEKNFMLDQNVTYHPARRPFQLELSCINMPAKKANKQRGAGDPFKSSATKDSNQRGLQKKNDSPHSEVDQLKKMTTTEFHEKQFLFEIQATEDYFQQEGGSVTHFLVRGINETRANNLRYAGLGLQSIRVLDESAIANSRN